MASQTAEGVRPRRTRDTLTASALPTQPDTLKRRYKCSQQKEANRDEEGKRKKESSKRNCYLLLEARREVGSLADQDDRAVLNLPLLLLLLASRLQDEKNSFVRKCVQQESDESGGRVLISRTAEATGADSQKSLYMLASFTRKGEKND